MSLIRKLVGLLQSQLGGQLEEKGTVVTGGAKGPGPCPKGPKGPVGSTKIDVQHIDLTRTKNRIKLNEGLRLEPYADSLGYPTIGYGHRLGDKGVDIRNYRPISMAQAVELFEQDFDDAVSGAVSILSPEVFEEMSDARKGVVVEMCFQLGDPQTHLSLIHI